MRKVLFYILTSLLISPAFVHASSLQDQLSAVAQAENQGKAQESREADLRQAQYERELRNEQSRRAKPMLWLKRSVRKKQLLMPQKENSAWMWLMPIRREISRTKMN